MQQAREESETAECDVDERVARADTTLYPNFRSVSVCYAGAKATSKVGAYRRLLTSDGREEDAEEHQEAVGATHVCS